MDDLSPGSFTAEDDFISQPNDLLQKSPRVPKNPMDSKKSPKPSRANKGARKYLPQACERHKMLHAKCPANCPDRLKRDAERSVPYSQIL
jgi:hypothetical protein